MWTLNFDATCVEVVFENMTSVCNQIIQNWNLGNVQNERAAIIADDVRRGLGMLPQRAIFEKASEGDFAKMSKPVQVCTACHFVQEWNDRQFISNLGIIPLCHLWPIRPQAEILFSHFWINAQLGYKWFWKIFRPNLFPIWEQVKCQIPYLSPIWREVKFYSRRVGGDFTFRQFVGKFWTDQ